MTVNRDALVRDLSDMIRIPSVNPYDAADPALPAEEAMAVFFERRLGELGLEVETRTVKDGRRNVWGRLKGRGTGPTVLLAGHLDTVGVEGYIAPFDPVVKDGKIYGCGSCDMKAGLATYLEVVRCLQSSDIPLAGDLVVAGLMDEEHGMLGSADFGETGPQVDYAIVAEPSQLAICPAHRGQFLMTIRTHGVSTHSSMPENGVNAIYHMMAVVRALQGYAADLANRAPDPICGHPTFSVGKIRGGTDACSVPDFCEVEIDRRPIPGETFDSYMEELTDVLERVKQDIPDLHYSFGEVFLNVPPLATPATSPVVKALQAATEDILGAPSPIHPFPGSTDAPNLQTDAVICGAGNLAQCHSLNEYIDIDEVEKAVRIYLNAIQRLQNAPAT